MKNKENIINKLDIILASMLLMSAVTAKESVKIDYSSNTSKIKISCNSKCKYDNDEDNDDYDDELDGSENSKNSADNDRIAPEDLSDAPETPNTKGSFDDLIRGIDQGIQNIIQDIQDLLDGMGWNQSDASLDKIEKSNVQVFQDQITKLMNAYNGVHTTVNYNNQKISFNEHLNNILDSLHAEVDRLVKIKGTVVIQNILADQILLLDSIRDKSFLHELYLDLNNLKRQSDHLHEKRGRESKTSNEHIHDIKRFYEEIKVLDGKLVLMQNQAIQTLKDFNNVENTKGSLVSRKNYTNNAQITISILDNFKLQLSNIKNKTFQNVKGVVHFNLHNLIGFGIKRPKNK